jgi:hypothetical protein
MGSNEPPLSQPLAVLLGIPSLTQRWRGQLLDPPVLDNYLVQFVPLFHWLKLNGSEGGNTLLTWLETYC